MCGVDHFYTYHTIRHKNSYLQISGKQFYKIPRSDTTKDFVQDKCKFIYDIRWPTSK